MLSFSHIILLAIVISLVFWKRWIELPEKIKESVRLFNLNYKGKSLDKSSILKKEEPRNKILP